MFSFKGSGEIARQTGQTGWQSLKRLQQQRIDDPIHYYTEDEGLQGAVNTALSLGMPLLLTGAPGVGKTQLAYRIAYELGCETIFFPVKSTSEAQDLFYFIDHLRRWHAARVEDSIDIHQFIRFQGLGLAILRAMPREVLEERGLWSLAWPHSEADRPGYGERRPTVVLIDEIDKAPTDFPNDLLEEVRRLWFRVPELSDEPLSIYRDPENPLPEEQHYRPVIVVTSNSEKVLPEPFLRRCVYYHIYPPDAEMLEKIINHRIIEREHGKLAASVAERSLSFFLYLRDSVALEKTPSTAELLNWMMAMSEQQPAFDAADCGEPPSARWLQLASYCLLKMESDQRKIGDLVAGWHHATS